MSPAVSEPAASDRSAADRSVVDPSVGTTVADRLRAVQVRRVAFDSDFTSARAARQRARDAAVAAASALDDRLTRIDRGFGAPRWRAGATASVPALVDACRTYDRDLARYTATAVRAGARRLHRYGALRGRALHAARRLRAGAR